jgi:hypothetical protein
MPSFEYMANHQMLDPDELYTICDRCKDCLTIVQKDTHICNLSLETRVAYLEEELGNLRRYLLGDKTFAEAYADLEEMSKLLQKG